MKRMYKRIVSSLLVGALLLSGCAPSKPVRDGRVDVTLSELVYERPDMEALSQKISSLEEEIGTKAKGKELISKYQEILNDVNSFNTMQGVLSFNHNKDVTNEKNATELELLKNYYSELDNKLISLTQTFLESSYKDKFINVMGEEFVERYERNSKLNSPEIEELHRQENAYVQEYSKAIVENYTTIYEGKEVTLDDLDYNDPDTYIPYYEIVKKQNERCGEIYLKLVKVRHEIAKKLNYDNYADYAYDTFGYDFELEDAKVFQENVINELVPVYGKLETRNQELLKEIGKIDGATIDRAIPTLEAALETEFPEHMQEALEYMTRNELYYFDDSPTMQRAAYSTILYDYLAPYMFINTTVVNNATTVFHEFGHYMNFYNYSSISWGDHNDLNLAEVHSQGLELLMHPYYDQLFPKETIEYQQISHVLSIISSVLQGCAEDEFQQRIYENPEITLDEANLIHGEIYEKYFGYPEYYAWVNITHHIETPMYYISYATSAISALEIYSIAKKDRTKALKIYDEMSQFTKNSPYLEALKSSGLRSPFEVELVKELASVFNEEM